MSTTGHESEAINVQGLKASLQKLKTNHIDGKAGKSTTLAGYGITDAYTKSETYTKTEVNGLVDTPHQEYVTVDAYANLPATGSKDTIYRVSNYNGSTSQVDASVYSEYAWDGTQYIFLCVKSQIGEVFDISVYNNNAKYADLAAALGTDGEHVPQSLRKGGMSVKFVWSSDNKYVQYRLMADTFSTILSDWKNDNEIWDSSSFHQDLMFSDEFNNIVGGFKNGHVVSKFPSPYVDNSNKDNLELADKDGNVVFSVKEGYPETKNFDGKELSETVGTLVNDKIQTITVSVADYNNNLKNCFESIFPSKNKHYIVLIPEGTYDIRSYYEDHIYGAGLYVPDYVRLQGIGAKEKIILQYRNTVDEWSVSRSTLNLHEWVEMDNLTIVSQYIRYTVHADTQTSTPYQKYFKITNCSFKHYNGYYSQAWGAGLKANTLCIFENCDFFTDFVNHGDYNVTEKPAFSYHNNGYGYTSSNIILNNCRFTNAGDGAVLAFYGTNAAQSQMMYVTLVGCKLNTYAYIGEYNQGNNGPEAKITGYANVMAQDPIIDVAESYTYSDYIDLI